MKRSQLLAIAALLGGAVLPLAAQDAATKAVAAPTEKAGTKHVDAKEAAKVWQENKTNKNFVILDVRTSSEFAEDHLPNAVNVDVLDQSFDEKAKKLDKSKTYMLHCRSGKRSQTALAKLEKLGFTSLYHLDGGLNAWKAAGNEVVKGEAEAAK